MCLGGGEGLSCVCVRVCLCWGGRSIPTEGKAAVIRKQRTRSGQGSEAIGVGSASCSKDSRSSLNSSLSLENGLGFLVKGFLVRFWALLTPNADFPCTLFLTSLK